MKKIVLLTILSLLLAAPYGYADSSCEQTLKLTKDDC